MSKDEIFTKSESQQLTAVLGRNYPEFESKMRATLIEKGRKDVFTETEQTQLAAVFGLNHKGFEQRIKEAKRAVASSERAAVRFLRDNDSKLRYSTVTKTFVINGVDEESLVTFKKNIEAVGGKVFEHLTKAQQLVIESGKEFAEKLHEMDINFDGRRNIRLAKIDLFK